MPQITPEQFGATGNGAADDTAALNKTLAEAKRLGGAIIIAEGNYKTTSQVSITNSPNTQIDGRGKGRIFLDAGAATNQHAIAFYGSDRIAVRDIRIEIPRSRKRESGGFALFFDRSNYIEVTRVNTDGGTAGIWALQCTHAVVRDCVVNTPKADGIHFGQGSSFCKALGNTVLNAGDDAFSTTFYTNWGRPHHIEFIGNIVDGSRWGSGVAAWSADHVTIKDNILKNIWCYGILLGNHENGGACSNAHVSGNQIYNACIGASQPDSYWNGSPVSNDPDIKAVKSYNSAISAECERSTIRDNHIVQTAQPNAKKYGVYLNNAFMVVVQGNTFFDIDGDGVYVESNCRGRLFVKDNISENVLGSGVRSEFDLKQVCAIVNNLFGSGATRGDSGNASLFLANDGNAPMIVAGNYAATGRGILSQNNGAQTKFFWNRIQSESSI